MSIHDDREAPIYHLLSNYNTEALTHGAWLASFIISIFTFMGLTLRYEDPRWGLGSFSILVSHAWLEYVAQ